MAFALSLFAPQVSFFRWRGIAVPHDCGISRVSVCNYSNIVFSSDTVTATELFIGSSRCNLLIDGS